jgi:hypothetical protein
LFHYLETALFQFTRQDSCVDRLEKTGAYAGMDPVSDVNDFPGDGVFRHGSEKAISRKGAKTQRKFKIKPFVLVLNFLCAFASLRERFFLVRT